MSTLPVPAEAQILKETKEPLHKFVKQLLVRALTLLLSNKLILCWGEVVHTQPVPTEVDTKLEAGKCSYESSQNELWAHLHDPRAKK